MLNRSNIDVIASVICALKLSRISSDGCFLVYTIQTLVIHCFMTSSSIQAFCWYVITALPLLLTPWIDLVVLPLKIIMGGSISPVATQESTAVNVLFF